MFGEVELKRAYYQCQIDEEENEQDQTRLCSHGEPQRMRYGGYKGQDNPRSGNSISAIYAPCSRFDEAGRGLIVGSPWEDVSATSAQRGLDQWGRH